MCTYIYRIPYVNATKFLQKLDELLNKLTQKSKKNIILCGDWNIDVLKTDASLTKELYFILQNLNFKIIVKHQQDKKLASI